MRPIMKQSRKGMGKDIEARVKLATGNRNRDFPRESECAKAFGLHREHMPTQPNPKVPDLDDDVPF